MELRDKLSQLLATFLQHQTGDGIVYSSIEALNTCQAQDKILLRKELKNKICSFIVILQTLLWGILHI